MFDLLCAKVRNEYFAEVSAGRAAASQDLELAAMLCISRQAEPCVVTMVVPLGRCGSLAG